LGTYYSMLMMLMEVGQGVCVGKSNKIKRIQLIWIRLDVNSNRRYR